MKKIILTLAVLTSLMSYRFVMADNFPATCPDVGKAIVTSVAGGCSAIDCNIYSNICIKCCTGVPAPLRVATTTPVVAPKLPIVTPKPTPTSTQIYYPAVTPTPTPAPTVQNVPQPKKVIRAVEGPSVFGNSNLRYWKDSSNVATNTTENVSSQNVVPKVTPNVGFVGKVIDSINSFFMIFGIGK